MFVHLVPLPVHPVHLRIHTSDFEPDCCSFPLFRVFWFVLAASLFPKVAATFFIVRMLFNFLYWLASCVRSRTCSRTCKKAEVASKQTQTPHKGMEHEAQSRMTPKTPACSWPKCTSRVSQVEHASRVVVRGPSDCSSVLCSSTHTHYHLTVNAPGVKQADIQVLCSDQDVEVRGSTGSFAVSRKLHLPGDANIDAATAHHADGALRIEVPRRPPRSIVVGPLPPASSAASPSSSTPQIPSAAGKSSAHDKLDVSATPPVAFYTSLEESRAELPSEGAVLEECTPDAANVQSPEERCEEQEGKLVNGVTASPRAEQSDNEWDDVSSDTPA